MLFEESGKRKNKSIPTLLLQGASGAGKTFLAETFAKMINADERFVQCFPRMGAENFQYDVNIKGVIKQDADNSIKEGILLQALQQSKEKPVVLVIDELDKARPEVDSFLLDFLENGRLTTGTDTYQKGQYPIYVIITSNDKREIDEALLNRSKKVEIPRPNKELFLQILGLPEDHYLHYVYDKCPSFSIRQARQYIEDLKVLGKDYDEKALSLYVDISRLDVVSIKDALALETFEIEVDLPELEKCTIDIDLEGPNNPWIELLGNGNPNNFRLYTYENDSTRMYVDIDTIGQLKKVCQHIDFKGNRYHKANVYSGWFEYSISEEEMTSGNIHWAVNNSNHGTRFGVKVDRNKMFRIAINRGISFVYLDSRNNTLENFLGEEVKDNEHDYGID